MTRHRHEGTRYGKAFQLNAGHGKNANVSLASTDGDPSNAQTQTLKKLTKFCPNFCKTSKKFLRKCLRRLENPLTNLSKNPTNRNVTRKVD